MKKTLLFCLVLCLMFACVARAEETPGIAADLARFAETRELFPGVIPAASKADLEAAGLVFGEEPVSTMPFEEFNTQSYTWEVQNLSEFTIEGYSITFMSCQIVEDQLINLTIRLPGKEETQAVCEALTGFFGEPLQQLSFDKTMQITRWYPEPEGKLMTVGIITMADGSETMASETLNISFLDLFVPEDFVVPGK